MSYTNPELRNRIKNRIMAGSKGGKIVKSRKQAIAIALSEAGKSKAKKK